jgi:hypothetical protein
MDNLAILGELNLKSSIDLKPGGDYSVRLGSFNCFKSPTHSPNSADPWLS